MTKKTTVFSLFIAPLFLMATLWACLVPYLQTEHYINRRTMIKTRAEVYFGIYRKWAEATKAQPGILRDLSAHGALTAPNKEVRFAKQVIKQYLWSEEDRHVVTSDNEEGLKLSIVADLLFMELDWASLHNTGEGETRLSSDKQTELYAQRIALWNSTFPETATAEQLKKIQLENSQFSPRSQLKSK